MVAGQKLASSCALVKPKITSIYTGNKKTITLFLMMESIVLLLLAVMVRFCCVFWKKKKLQGLDLGKFLDKRVRKKKIFLLDISNNKPSSVIVLILYMCSVLYDPRRRRLTK